MKRVIVAMFVALATPLFATASQTQWGFLQDDVYGADGSAFRGGTALLFVTTSLGATPTFDSASGTWNMNGAILADTLGYDSDYEGWGIESWKNLDTVQSGSTSGATQQYFSVILTEDADVSDLSSYSGNYAYAFSQQGLQKVYTASPLEYGTQVNNWNVEINQSDWLSASAGSVPEPTSGLLLLLGVAGLALRRKIA